MSIFSSVQVWSVKTKSDKKMGNANTKSKIFHTTKGHTLKFLYNSNDGNLMYFRIVKAIDKDNNLVHVFYKTVKFQQTYKDPRVYKYIQTQIFDEYIISIPERTEVNTINRLFHDDTINIEAKEEGENEIEGTSEASAPEEREEGEPINNKISISILGV